MLNFTRSTFRHRGRRNDRFAFLSRDLIRIKQVARMRRVTWRRFLLYQLFRALRLEATLCKS